MKMEIIATFSIQLYISIYSTLGFNFSYFYTMFCADCSSILFEVINTQSYQLHHIVCVDGRQFLFSCVVEQSLMCNCG